MKVDKINATEDARYDAMTDAQRDAYARRGNAMRLHGVDAELLDTMLNNAGEVSIAAAGTPFVSSSYVGVPIAIRIDGKLARTVVAGYRVTTYVRTAVASHDLAPGAVLAPGDVTLARLPSHGRPAVGVDVLVGRRLNVATAAGAALYVEETIPNAVVKAGQAAILVIHDGFVALMADVVARTGGAIGDTVTVVNPQTQRAIAGIVTAPNRVELTLPGGER